MRLILITALFLPSVLLAQLRFKPMIEGGAGFSKENFYTVNSGILVEKKLDIDKSIETGLLYHSFEFYRQKDAAFYQAFVQGNNLDPAWDTTSHVQVGFHFTTIPVGANYYITPKFFAGYRIGFNFFKRSTFSGIDARSLADPVDGLETFTHDFDKKLFKRFYLNHTISFNYIVMRRFDMGLGFMFTPRGRFFRQTPNQLYESFNEEVSRYFAMTVHFQLYLFQIKSRSL